MQMQGFENQGRQQQQKLRLQTLLRFEVAAAVVLVLWFSPFVPVVVLPVCPSVPGSAGMQTGTRALLTVGLFYFFTGSIYSQPSSAEFKPNN